MIIVKFFDILIENEREFILRFSYCRFFQKRNETETCSAVKLLHFNAQFHRETFTLRN